MGFLEDLMSRFGEGSRRTASDNPDDIFSYSPQKRQVRETTGRLGYFKKKKVLGVTVGGHVVDEISGKVERHSDLMQKKAEVWGTQGKSEVETAVAGFQEFGLQDMKLGYATKKMAERTALRSDAVEDTNNITAPYASVQNVAQAQGNLNARVQGFLNAKRKLKAANNSSLAGASFKYNDTGYDMLNPTMDQFYAEFDADVAQAQQTYAEMYGADSFDEVGVGFGMFSSEELDVNSAGRTAAEEAEYVAANGNINPLTGQIEEYDTGRDTYDYTRTSRPQGDVGQQDIMNMIMSDMTGISYEDVHNMSTAEMGYDKFRSGDGYTMEEGNRKAQNVGAEGVEAMREAYSTIFFSAGASSDAAAAMEDQFRADAAAKAKSSTMTAQKRTKALGDEATAEAITDINAGIRTAEQEYEQTKYRLLQPGIGGKRKVKDVSFKSTRPE
jgi:hypothetical protein